MNAIHILLQNSIDYAGLFPPAGLPMSLAVEHYSRYLASDASWALGRFVIPASRLSELETVAGQRPASGATVRPWQLSALLGPDLFGELQIVADFNHRLNSAGLLIDSLETKASSVDAVEEIVHRLPRDLQCYIEVPITQDPTEMVTAIGRAGARAKVRTGGVTPDAFPDATDLIRFMASCIRTGVVFKATAGLHHPVRAEYRLTYQPDSPHGPMFGFLNLFLAAAFMHAGMSQRQAAKVLEETSAQAFRLDDQGVTWRTHRLDEITLKSARQQVITSFGSCSFTEPIDELQALHLLEPGVPQA